MRVLIVEDDLSMGALLMQLIKRLWPQSSVVLETTALAALERWKDAGADLVLLDWGLPGMSGIEVLKHIKKSASKTVCVMISGHADRDSILAAGAHHVDAFIVKPFDVNDVMTRLSRLMSVPSETAAPEANGNTFDDFVQFHLTQGTLGLPIDPDLVSAIKRIRDMQTEEQGHLLRRCQIDSALVFRALSLANLHPYSHGADPVETFDEALHRIGLDGLTNLAVEMSLLPGSALKQDFLKARRLDFQRDCLALADIITKLGADVEFDVKVARGACPLYRVGELSLLQLMQAWLDLGHALDDSVCATVLTRDCARAGNRIKIQWNLPNSVRAHIGAAYLLPAGIVKKDQVLMRIAGLAHEGDHQQELPRLLARLGLAENAAEHYRVHDVVLGGWSA